MSHAFEKFLAELKLLLKDCGYRDPDELVRDRVVIGCRSQKSKREANTEGFEANNRTSYRRSSHPWVAIYTQLKTMAGEDPSVVVHRLKHV